MAQCIDKRLSRFRKLFSSRFFNEKPILVSILYISYFVTLVSAQIKPPGKPQYQPSKKPNKNKKPSWEPNSVSYNEDKVNDASNQITPNVDGTFNIEACDKAEKVSERIYLITKNLEIFVKQMKKNGQNTADLPIKAQPVRIQIMFARLKRNLQRLYLVRKRGGSGLKEVRQCKHQTTIDKITNSAETLGKIFNKKFNLLPIEENAAKDAQKEKNSKGKRKNKNKSKKEMKLEKRSGERANLRESDNTRPQMQNDAVNFFEDDEEYADTEWDNMPSQFFSDFVEPAKNTEESESAEYETNTGPGTKDYEMSRSFTSRALTGDSDGTITGLKPRSVKNDTVESKLTKIMEEPSCPSAWNSFLPITFIPKALKTGAGNAVCTDPFFAQLHNKPQIRLIVASQVAAWKLERSDSLTTEILKSWQLRACLNSLENQVFIHVDNSLRNTSGSARRLFNEFQHYYKLPNLAGMTFYWPHKGNKLVFLQEVIKLIKIMRFYFDPKPIKLVLTKDKVFLVGFPTEEGQNSIKYDHENGYNGQFSAEYDLYGE